MAGVMGGSPRQAQARLLRFGLNDRQARSRRGPLWWRKAQPILCWANPGDVQAHGPAGDSERPAGDGDWSGAGGPAALGPHN